MGHNNDTSEAPVMTCLRGANAINLDWPNQIQRPSIMSKMQGQSMSPEVDPWNRADVRLGDY